MPLDPMRDDANNPSMKTPASNWADAAQDQARLDAVMLLKAGNFDAAARAFESMIEADPQNWQNLYLLGYVHLRQHKLDRAAELFKRCLDINPQSAEAHCDLGVVLKETGDFGGAQIAFEKALALNPGLYPAYNNLGNIYKAQGKLNEAVDCYRQMTQLMPNSADGYANLGSALRSLGQIEEALAAFAKALAIDGDHPSALMNYYHLRRDMCAWEGIARIEEKILSETFRKGRRVPVFPIFNISDNAEDHLLCAQEWAKGIKSPVKERFTHIPPAADRPLRIGYLSNDFCRHATARLIAELIERHDRNRFEIFGYCFSIDDGSEIHQRMIRAFDRFTRIAPMSYSEAAHCIHRDGIDILIDLKGYTTGARTEILAAKPAPVQINYLGYPGTMGASFIDYIIADPFIAPMNQQPYFTEKIIHLPGCYQPNDTKRAIASSVPSRAECGLPESGFVFCSFNGSYKITSEIFGVWMKILTQIPGSVLWLLESNGAMRGNLQRQAVALGVDPARLIFAPKLEHSQHLARHRHADLFLDSLPVNAHTSASDALWTGLPVLTCAGKTFVSRVCGSLLKSVGLDELIAYSLGDYERMAIDLARNPGRLAGLRERLMRDRHQASLFDIAHYTAAFEAALEHIAELHARGQQPRAFAVQDD